MVHLGLLIVHVAAGTGGLVLGILALAANKGPGRHPLCGRAYQLAVALLAASAAGLVLLDPARLWGFGVIAVATEAAAVAGWVVRRRQRPGWLPRHVSLMCGSYLSLVTALLVVNWSSPLAWVIPTVVGSPLIALAAARTTRPGPVLVPR